MVMFYLGAEEVPRVPSFAGIKAGKPLRRESQQRICSQKAKRRIFPVGNAGQVGVRCTIRQASGSWIDQC
jgi:hypothetical protein